MSKVRSPAIVLLSGGMDSATTLAVARDQGFDCHAISFRYGQRHHIELEAASRVASALGAISHRIVSVDLGQFGGSALTDPGTPVPRDNAIDEIGSAVPVTYVPARNTIFLSFALAHAEVLGASDIFIGVTAVDWSGYPDCRPEFIEAFQQMARLGTTIPDLTVHAPLAELSKSRIVALGMELGVDFGLTRTCYDPDQNGAACGVCDACQLRLRGFSDLGLTDPAPYR